MDIYGNGLALGGIAHMFGNTDVHGRDNKANLQIQRETNAMNYLIQGRFYYLIFQTGASRQNLIKPRLSAFVSCKINDLV